MFGFGSSKNEKCINCGETATKTVDGEPVCGNCNVYHGNQGSGRAYTIVSKH